ncbi:hypothetical protein DNHGIG_28630 [Collibacillus ludicampi]|uniref:Uncharacterized protein n=1 Tax=Collibacillus ludicampi TaxID=2771369 RepID=A0AAV4LHY1_9BACL|nr:hypothetical protein [Collibacillus ludicampi]GIM47314.1 hypothetical protein DNHGIG_28630 [Collibacillus ludicampi]
MKKLYKLMNDCYLKHVTVNRYLSDLGEKKNELMKKISDLNARYESDIEKVSTANVLTEDQLEIKHALDSKRQILPTY